VKDEPADRSEDFGIVQVMMDEIHNHVNMLQENRNRLAGVMMEEMANVIYGSNQKARKGLGLDETHKICHAIFEGDGGIEYRERYAFTKENTRSSTYLCIGLPSTRPSLKSLSSKEWTPAQTMSSGAGQK
jgi:hypothetical protein